MKDEGLQQVLDELSELTRSQPHISTFLSEQKDACIRTPEVVQSMVSDLRLWGGMGSVADEAGVGLRSDQQRRVQELLIRLYELLERRGVTDPRGASWVQTFREWRDSASPEAGPA